MSPRSHISLDGQWCFSLTKIFNTDDCFQIPVPSPWQADARFRDHTGEAWYQRGFDVPAEWLESGRVLILGFGAVDYCAEVWLNDIKVGEHEGGYLPFELDISKAARAGENTLTVRVEDSLETFPEIPHGKQSWYGMLSGIWQSVWVESRAASHIQRVRILTDGGEVSVELGGRGDFTDGLTAEIFDSNGQVVARVEPEGPRFSLHLEQPRLWSPDEPNLYTLKLSTPSDEVTETFGIRTIETRDGKILLNGRPFYLRGALDQDYYPELISTPPSLEYIEDQFRKAKDMGLNCLRIHIKVADPRYYTAADKVGLLIWTELPNHILLSQHARRRAHQTLVGMLERDGNHPSIGIWTIINESWGIDLTDPSQRAWLTETYEWFKELDPTRLVVGNSACWSNFHVVTDIADFHSYYAMPDHLDKWRKWTNKYAGRPWWLFAHEYTAHKQWREFLLDPWHGNERPLAPDAKPKGDEPLLVSEFGNWGLPDVHKLYEGNGGTAPWWFDTGLNWNEGVVYPRGIEQRFREYHLDRVFPSLAALTEASQRLQLDALKFEIEDMRAHPSIQGYVVTELTDVHWESNGLLDMYRNPKVCTPFLHKFNADDVLIPIWDRLAYTSGENCSIRILFSHYSPVEINDALLVWEVSSDNFEVSGAQLLAAECLPFEITELGFVSFATPQVKDPTMARIEMKLFNGEELIASTYQEIYIFPEPVPSGEGQAIYSPEFHRQLEKLGYAITTDLSQAKVAVVTVLDDTFREFVLRGGRVLLLAEDEDALQMRVPGLDIEEREDSAWQGDWASTLGWHRFDKLPTGNTVNFAFAGLTPECVIGDFSARDFAFHVYAGLFAGWL
ncbi:MAG TPA: glycoside hydrolase family 2 TIM barrel-domain containing protein, partial [Anaerolineales bacterium]|nr:glycoside hydrolase family 2 TIM barrel-domain containing protein [Anaerolineales bacterium]